MDNKGTGILLINKKLALLDFAVDTLKGENYPIYTASNMRDALETINQQPVGLILCGLELEDVSGVQFLSYLKKDPLRESIPFIFFVSIENQGKLSPKRVILMGAEDLIFFPLDKSTLLSRIQEFVQPPQQNGNDDSVPSQQRDSGRKEPVSKTEAKNKAQKTETKTSAVAPPIKHENFPIQAKASKDGLLWVDAQITSCETGSAHIQTLMLGKPGEEIKLKLEQDGSDSIVVGRIKQIEIENEEMLAHIEIDFDENSGWFPFFSQLCAMSDSTSVGKRFRKTPREQTEKDKTPPKGDKDITDDMWAKGVLLEEKSGKEPELSISKNNRKDFAVIGKRFYQSLVGRKMDNYEVVSFISSGAMGGVFKGFDTALERDVALKVISWDLASQEKFVEMFFKEARFVSKLNHPNIAQIYHIGNSNGIVYYAMEFVRGYTFLELNKRKLRFDLRQLINYLSIVCHAMDYVWDNKIIHRDLKPANIMLKSDDTLKIVDFGVAKFEKKDKNKKEAKIVGSPLYLSPEAICNQKVDHRSDIYSLGATFYHMIAGTPPYMDISMKKILAKHLRSPVPQLKTRVPGVPGYLSDLIEKMMAKRVKDRFSGYQEIIECIENFP